MWREVVIAAAAIVGGNWDPAQGQSAPPPPGRPPTAVTMPASGVDVPMPTPGDRPIVDAWIDGRGPFHLGVETGNPMAVTLFVDALARLGASAPDTAAKSLQQLDSVRIGGMTLRGVDVAVPGPSPLPTQLDGQLGLAAYANLLLTVDFPGHRLRFARDTLPAVNNADILPVSPAGPVLSVPMTIASRQATLILDTQGGVGLSVTPDQATAQPTAAPPVVVGAIRSPALGTVSRTMARLAGDAHFGEYVFQRPFLTFAPVPRGLNVDGLIGIHALRSLSIALDQRTHRVRIRARSHEIAAPGPYR